MLSISFIVKWLVWSDERAIGPEGNDPYALERFLQYHLYKQNEMYEFNIGQEADGSYRFEKNGIFLLIDAFYEQNGKHYIQNPSKAIAFFKTGGNLYGISNNLITHKTVEDFFESMSGQYSILGKTVSH